MKRILFICLLSVMAVTASVRAEAGTIYNKENGRLYSGISKSLIEMGADAGAGTDAGTKADARTDAGVSAGKDTYTGTDAGMRADASMGAGANVRADAGMGAGAEANVRADAGMGAGTDVGAAPAAYTVYTTANVNVRSRPDTQSEKVEVLLFNTKLEVYDYNEKWCCIEGRGYIRKDYLSREGNAYQNFDLPGNSGFKSFMSYRAITCRASEQFLLQDVYAYTGSYGIRQVGGRYCVAVGTAFDAQIGTYLDLVLENGTVIPCIVADIKASRHTLADNITTAASGCVSEFVVDTGRLSSAVRRYGDVSKCCSDWDSPVESIRIYGKNIL